MGVVALLAAGASIWAWTISAGHIETAGERPGDGEAARAPVAIVLGAAVDAARLFTALPSALEGAGRAWKVTHKEQ